MGGSIANAEETLAASRWQDIVFQESRLEIYLVDGTYELFRHYYAMPSRARREGSRGRGRPRVVSSVLGMINGGAQYVGVATDHVIEVVPERALAGYKTGEGIEPDLLAQFPLLEAALAALGIATWPMVEFEADDALAAAATAAARDPRVERIVICTPDKDLAQCVRGTRIVQMDRRRRTIRDEAGVVEKFGVPPASIPINLALVGDAADGYPGLPGWGARSARPCSRGSGTSSRFARLARVEGRQRRSARGARLHAGAAARSGVPVPGSGDVEDGYCVVRFGRGASAGSRTGETPAYLVAQAPPV